MWVLENQYHPLWSIENLGGLDCLEYVFDWLARFVAGTGKPTKAGSIKYIRENGFGPFSPDCEWTPPVNGEQAYF